MTLRRREVVLRTIIIYLPLLLLIDCYSIGQKLCMSASSAGPEGRLSGCIEAPQVQLNDKERTFLSKQYDVAVQEIKYRLDLDQALFVLNFTMIGAVLGVIGYTQSGKRANDIPTKSHVAALCCWAATVVGVILAIRRQYNSDVIVQLGTWVGRSVECYLLPAPTSGFSLGWEQFIATESSLWHSASYPVLRIERELLTWIVYLATFTIFVPVSTAGANIELFALARRFGTLLFLLFGVVSLHYAYWDVVHVMYSVVVATLGVVAVQLWYYTVCSAARPEPTERHSPKSK